MIVGFELVETFTCFVFFSVKFTSTSSYRGRDDVIRLSPDTVHQVICMRPGVCFSATGRWFDRLFTVSLWSWLVLRLGDRTAVWSIC